METFNMIIVEMKKHFETRALEWWSAGLMASWGLYALYHPGLFSESTGASGLLMLTSQSNWRLIATIVGFARLVALMVNGMWKKTPAIRWGSAMISVLIWFLITAGFLMSSVGSMGVIVYFWHMVADMYSAFRSASDYFEAQSTAKIEGNKLTELNKVETNVRSISPR